MFPLAPIAGVLSKPSASIPSGTIVFHDTFTDTNKDLDNHTTDSGHGWWVMSSNTSFDLVVRDNTAAAKTTSGSSGVGHFKTNFSTADNSLFSMDISIDPTAPTTRGAGIQFEQKFNGPEHGKQIFFRHDGNIEFRIVNHVWSPPDGGQDYVEYSHNSGLSLENLFHIDIQHTRSTNTSKVFIDQQLIHEYVWTEPNTGETTMGLAISRDSRVYVDNLLVQTII